MILSYSINNEYCGIKIDVDIRDGRYRYSIKVPEIDDRDKKEISRILSREDIRDVIAYLERYPKNIRAHLVLNIFTELVGPLLDDNVIQVNYSTENGYVEHTIAGNLIIEPKPRREDVLKLASSLQEVLGLSLTWRRPIVEMYTELLYRPCKIYLCRGDLDISKDWYISLKFYNIEPISILDIIRNEFATIDSMLILATCVSFKHSPSIIFTGPPRSRKIDIMTSLISFFPQNSTVAILQEEPEINITDLPRLYIENYHSRKVGIEDITLLDLMNILSGRNYDKIMISQVRSQEEIYMMTKLLEQCLQIMTTLNSSNIELSIKKLLSGRYNQHHVDKDMLSPIKIIVEIGYVKDKPKLKNVYYIDFMRNTKEILYNKDSGINSDCLTKLMEELAEYNGVEISEVMLRYRVIESLLRRISKEDTRYNIFQIRELFLRSLEE